MLRQLIPMNTWGHTGELDKQPAPAASPAVPRPPCTSSLGNGAPGRHLSPPLLQMDRLVPRAACQLSPGDTGGARSTRWAWHAVACHGEWDGWGLNPKPPPISDGSLGRVSAGHSLPSSPDDCLPDRLLRGAPGPDPTPDWPLVSGTFPSEMVLTCTGRGGVRCLSRSPSFLGCGGARPPGGRMPDIPPPQPTQP